MFAARRIFNAQLELLEPVLVAVQHFGEVALRDVPL